MRGAHATSTGCDVTLQTGIRRVVRVPVMGTPKLVKVIVYDYGSDRVGSFILNLKPAGK